MFRRLLVANRGEIAVRIFRTCRRLGIETVAVHSDADADAVFVRAADRAVGIGASPPAESYLRIERIIEAALEVGADAIHPGYGFLSERPEFAEACASAGIVFVGPGADAMRRLGSKLGARDLAVLAGVPVGEGSGPLHDPAGALAAAARIGYPVLVKPADGGGGIGMKVVRSPGELEPALAAAAKAAGMAFGSATVYLERYLASPRHIEIQLLRDMHGNGVHLGERECSIQRRHQKLIEESPSVAVDDALRHEMGTAALRIAEAAGYVNAGTAEFLVEDGRYFFLEVNARLQVEHPVTEAVTGIDLVEQQLRVAAGEALSFGQADVRCDGHAIEFRINAEHPAKNFAPSPKAITLWDSPGGEGVRLDSGVEAGSAVPIFYDSLLAKLDRLGRRPNRGDRAGSPSACVLRRRWTDDDDPIPPRRARPPGFHRGQALDEVHRRATGVARRRTRADGLTAARRSILPPKRRRPGLSRGDSPGRRWEEGACGAVSGRRIFRASGRPE